MAYANFKQTFWSKHYQRELENKAILAEWCNREFEGEAKYGNLVKILGVGAVTIGNYEGTTIGSPETVADASVMLAIDKAKYFNFGVDDVDKAQSKPGLMEVLMAESAYAMAHQIDTDIAAVSVNAGTISSSTQINSAATAKPQLMPGLSHSVKTMSRSRTKWLLNLPRLFISTSRTSILTLTPTTANS